MCHQRWRRNGAFHAPDRIPALPILAYLAISPYEASVVLCLRAANVASATLKTYRDAVTTIGRSRGILRWARRQLHRPSCSGVIRSRDQKVGTSGQKADTGARLVLTQEGKTDGHLDRAIGHGDLPLA